MHRVATIALAATAGFGLAFFFVFRTLFADGPAEMLHAEYLAAYALNVLGYGLVLLLLTRFASTSPWWMVVAAPGLLIVLLYADAGMVLRLLTCASVAAGTLLGWWAGAVWRRQAMDHGVIEA